MSMDVVARSEIKKLKENGGEMSIVDLNEYELYLKSESGYSTATLTEEQYNDISKKLDNGCAFIQVSTEPGDSQYTYRLTVNFYRCLSDFEDMWRGHTIMPYNTSSVNMVTIYLSKINSRDSYKLQLMEQFIPLS